MSLAVVTRDDAAVPIIGRNACPAAGRLLPSGSGVGCGQDRKGSAEDDCRRKCDLCKTRHLSYLLRLFAAGAATAHSIGSTKRSRYSRRRQLMRQLQITFSLPISEDADVSRWESFLRFVPLPNSRPPLSILGMADPPHAALLY